MPLNHTPGLYTQQLSTIFAIVAKNTNRFPDYAGSYPENGLIGDS